MRIGIISTMHGVPWGGSEELWADLARQALRTGYRVSVCLTRPRPDHLKWHALEEAGADLFCEPGAWYLRDHRPARVAGVLHHRLGKFLDERTSPLPPFFSSEPDVLLVSEGASIPNIEVLDAIRERYTGKPYFVLSHSNHGEIVETTHRKKAASLYRDAQSALFVSKNNLLATERQLLQKLSNARVVRNPVNLDSLDPVDWPEDETATFASIGRLDVAHKGQDILLKALSEARWRQRDWRLSIYGVGQDAEYLRGLSDYYGLSGQVSLLGQTDNIRQLWRTHQALVLPSRFEGTPLVLVEAMLCGRPVIGTAIAGIPEWVQDGRNGFLAEAPAVTCFATALENAWQQRSQWRDMGGIAREDALLLYDPSPVDTLMSIVVGGMQAGEIASRRSVVQVTTTTLVTSVSIVIPVYNGERTIAQAVDSALAQDYQGHEVIVVNDGSTDSTPAILQKYGDRIQVVTQPNGGLSAARNAGVRHSNGKYIAFLDADDSWLPEKLKIMVAALERNPLASLAFSEYRFIDNNGLEIGESSLGHAPSTDDLVIPRPLPILPSTWVLPRGNFDRAGGFCEQFKGAQGFEDTWMLLLLREQGEFVYTPQSLTLYNAVHSGTTADKYRDGMYIFISLLKERYASDSRRWIRNIKNSQCMAMLSKVAHQMNNGDRRGALCTLFSILLFRPSYFFGADFRQRLFLPQNVRRLRSLTSVLSRAHE